MNRYSPVYAWYVVVVLLLLSVLGWLDRQIIAFLVDPIKADLNLSDTQFGIITGTAFAIFYALMGLPIGRLVDSSSRRAIIAAGVAAWSIMTAACGLAKNFTGMFAARVGVGIGEATLNPASISMLNDLFPGEKATLPVAIFTMGIFLGGGVAVILGGEVVQLLSAMDAVRLPLVGEVSAWRATFFVVGLPGVLMALLFFLTCREPERRLSAAESRLSDGSAIPLGTVLGFLNRNRGFYLYIFAGYALHSTAVIALWSWLPAMLSRTFEMQPAEIARSYGVIYLVTGILGALIIGPIGAIARKYRVRNILVIVPALFVLINIVPATYAPLAQTPQACLAWLAVALFCIAVTVNVSYATVSAVTPNRMRGLTVAIFISFINITAGTLGAMLTGLLSDHVFSPETVRYSLSTISAACMPCAALCFFLAIRGHGEMLDRVEGSPTPSSGLSD